MAQDLATIELAYAEVPFNGFFVTLYSDPRWHSFLRKINRTPEQLAKIEFKMPPVP